MFKKLNRVIVVATLGVLGLLIAADAQSKPPTPPTNRIHITRPGNGADRNKVSSIGWYYGHPQNCDTFSGGAGVVYTIVYLVEGGYFYTADTRWQIAMAPACQTGNWLGFYVYDSSGDWDDLYTYTFK